MPAQREKKMYVTGITGCEKKKNEMEFSQLVVPFQNTFIARTYKKHSCTLTQTHIH